MHVRQAGADTALFWGKYNHAQPCRTCPSHMQSLAVCHVQDPPCRVRMLLSRYSHWLHVQQTHHASAAGLLMCFSYDAIMQGLNLGALNVETDRRGFVPVNDKMQVLDSKGKTVPHLYCIGDANGEPASPAQCNPCPFWHSKRNMCNNNLHIVPVAPGCTLLSVFKVHPTACSSVCCHQ